GAGGDARSFPNPGGGGGVLGGQGRRGRTLAAAAAARQPASHAQTVRLVRASAAVHQRPDLRPRFAGELPAGDGREPAEKPARRDGFDGRGASDRAADRNPRPADIAAGQPERTAQSFPIARGGGIAAGYPAPPSHPPVAAQPDTPAAGRPPSAHGAGLLDPGAPPSARVRPNRALASAAGTRRTRRG